MGRVVYILERIHQPLSHMTSRAVLTWVFLAVSAWPALAQRAPVESFIAIYDMESGETRVVTSAKTLYEAPNWSPDGEHLIFNSGGKLYRIPVAGGEPVLIPTGNLNRVINDHGPSPDGTRIAFTNIGYADGSVVDGHIYVIPAEGGEPRRITNAVPSYWHGWSPDGKELAYCAQRDGNFDIYVISADGGEERRITTAPGYDDGPDYSPDGKYIYFNSDRSGTWDVWRIPTGSSELDGVQAERITSDEYEDWFPHPSPDGKHIVFLSYEPGTEGHPPNRNVQLRALPGDGSGTPRTLLNFFGGQGTINVSSWSPDSKAFAFVYYRLLEE